MTPTDEATFIQLWQQGATYTVIARALGIPGGTVGSRATRLAKQGKITPRPRGGAYPKQQAQQGGEPEALVHRGPPQSTDVPSTQAHRGTPAVSRRHTAAHPGTPARQPTPVHSGVPLPQDLGVRLLALLPDLEVLVARERDRQRLVSTPVGTPQHTVKKTYVVEMLYVDLIERYAKDEGFELKDVVNLAFHEFFERRDYLPPASQP
jgi:hypothetical protein